MAIDKEVIKRWYETEATPEERAQLEALWKRDAEEAAKKVADDALAKASHEKAIETRKALVDSSIRGLREVAGLDIARATVAHVIDTMA